MIALEIELETGSRGTKAMRHLLIMGLGGAGGIVSSYVWESLFTYEFGWIAIAALWLIIGMITWSIQK